MNPPIPSGRGTPRVQRQHMCRCVSIGKRRDGWWCWCSMTCPRLVLGQVTGDSSWQGKLEYDIQQGTWVQASRCRAQNVRALQKVRCAVLPATLPPLQMRFGG